MYGIEESKMESPFAFYDGDCGAFAIATRFFILQL
jgi:hypothetical protein